MNSIFVANKPLFISSNQFLNNLKKKYKTKKMGFSGTLDPFACGCLIIATGQYPKLFNYIKKTPKNYTATIWLGAQSSSLDIENIISIEETNKLHEKIVLETLEDIKGELSYLPPKYSAKKIDGQRAYTLARNDIDFELKKITSTIYDIKLINYNHPYITFNITVSEGAYIRSIAQIILEKLNTVGTLSYLKREYEGEFLFNNEKKLDIIKFLDLPHNVFFGSKELFINGKVLNLDEFENKKQGKYIIEFEDFFSIISIDESGLISYILNRVEKC